MKQSQENLEHIVKERENPVKCFVTNRIEGICQLSRISLNRGESDYEINRLAPSCFPCRALISKDHRGQKPKDVTYFKSRLK